MKRMEDTPKLHWGRRGLLALLALLLVLMLAAVLFGSTRLSLGELLQALDAGDRESPAWRIFFHVRLPRMLAGALCGSGLAVAGAVLQVVLNNSLAGPNIIGVNAGAGFAMVLAMCLFPMAYRWLPLMAFAGAFACTLLIVLIARRAGGSRVTIVLAGVAVSTLLSAATSLLRLRYPDLAVSYTYFSVGGVSGVTFSQLMLPAVLILVVFFAAMLLAGRLNLLCLGDHLVHSLGVRAKLLRTLALVFASASAAAAVSFAGLLGFVGLMIPHISRRLTGTSDVRRLLPAAALLGGTLVVLSDLLGRVLFAPSEIPAGIITALLGAPFFFVLLLQRRNRL